MTPPPWSTPGIARWARWNIYSHLALYGWTLYCIVGWQHWVSLAIQTAACFVVVMVTPPAIVTYIERDRGVYWVGPITWPTGPESIGTGTLTLWDDPE